ncbi:MAG: DUF4199 domain-containing protein [Ferruginibacter sp.]
MKKITLNFGLMAGAIIIVYSFIVFMVFGDFSKMTPGQFQMVEVLGYLRYIILLLTVFFAMRTFKKNTGQSLNYWKIVKQGVMVALVVAVCVGIMEAVYLSLNPDFYEKFGKMYVEQLKAGGATEKAINAAKQEMENYKWMQNPLMTGIFYFFETALIGSVASLIMGRFMKSKKQTQTI